MRLVGPSLADYSIDKLPTVLIKSIPPHLFFFYCAKMCNSNTCADS